MAEPEERDEGRGTRDEGKAPTCVNLLELYGERFKIGWDESYDARGKHRDNLDPWMMQLPCEGKGVTMYPHGGTRLAVEINYRPKLARKVCALEGVTLSQDGDGEKTFLFDIAVFEQVAALVKPRKRRHLSDAHREALKPHAFRSQVRDTTPESTISPKDDQPGTSDEIDDSRAF